MKQILIVDDSKTSILLLTKMLPEYSIVSALNGNEMWEKLMEGKPSLILMDVILPDTDGYTLVEELSKTEDYKDIPIIFQTAKSSSADLAKGFESGAIDYIRKPVEKQELRARIKSVLKIKELENQLYLKTITDHLTDIYNRRFFFEIAEKHLRSCQSMHKNLSIAILDIDFFKKINDTYGHVAGDFILKKFTEVITQIKRPRDVFARYGGEEFILLFFETDKSVAKEILCKIQSAIIGNKVFFNKSEIQFTFSCGIVELREMGISAQLDDLIKLADKRLYIAKDSGRNKIVDID